jgi:hypothetical protein
MLGLSLLRGRPKERRHVMVNNVELGGTITSVVMGGMEGAHDVHAS